jgi:hypothetical protein
MGARGPAERTRAILARNVVLLERQRRSLRRADDPMKRAFLTEEVRKTQRFIRELQLRLSVLGSPHDALPNHTR